MQLKPGTKLQNGKYEIIKTLGQGGFGITYLAEQVALHRKVAIKEFFMKEYCERDETTKLVTLGTSSGSKELVARFRAKFIREAQMIAGLEHPNIVKIHDVFEENGTAYYVMEFLEGESLSDRVKETGPLPEKEALKYIRQVGEALSYLHGQNCLHFDVKPSNILVNKSSNAVLIDFGVSKHYDAAGSQTSSTPVGISRGYAPMEQYQQNEISTFTPATDIYALGATLYTLLTGEVPPSASEVYEDGVPPMPEKISKTTRAAVEKAMQPRRKDRPQTVGAFMSLLDADYEGTIVDLEPHPIPKPKPKPKPESKPIPKPKPAPKPTPEKKKSKTWLWALLGAAAVAAVAAIIAAIVLGGRKEKPIDDELIPPVESTAVAEPAVEQTQAPALARVASGSLKVTSTPSGATIWLDGKNTEKNTPATIDGLDPSNYSIRLVLDGYLDYKGSIVVVADSLVEIKQKLTVKTSVSSPSGSVNGHGYVDLGLSVKWATCNVGATKPEDYGSYFAWGETKPKREYTWANYKFRETGDSDYKVTFNKYNTKSNRGTVDNKKELDLSDDAARQNWGGTWRIPTDAELTELREKCVWAWTKLGGKNGYKVTSKTNGNSIFLPAAGCRKESGLLYAGSDGSCWSSSLYDTDHAFPLYFNSKEVCRGYGGYRFLGNTVRPVTK